VRLSDQLSTRGFGYWLVYPEERRLVPKIKRFKEKEAEAKKKLKTVRKGLRQDIDSLENRLKWTNIAAMPVIVTILGIVLAVIRKQRTKAQ